MVTGGFFNKIKKVVQKKSTQSGKGNKSQGCCDLQIVENASSTKKDKTNKAKGCCDLQIVENSNK